MENKNQKFEVGQEVKIMRCCYGVVDIVALGTISKINEEGVEVNLVAGNKMNFNPNGIELGYWVSRNNNYLCPMEDEETIASIQDDRKAKEAQTAEAEAEAMAEYEIEVIKWWEAEGKQMWTDATLCDELLGCTIRLIKYVSRGENRMALVAFSRTEYSNQPIYTAEALCGLTTWQNNTKINSFSSSTVTGRTIMEMLYNIVH